MSTINAGMYLFFLAICWLLFFASHSVLATTRVKLWFIQRFNISQNNYRLIYNLLSILFFAPALYFGFLDYRFKIFSGHFIFKLAGVTFIIIGLSGMLYSIYQYFNQMVGVKPTGNQLIISGLNQYIRHPLYTSTFLLCAGITFTLPYYSILLSMVFVIVYTLIATRWEEQKLSLIFGEQYLTYKKRTPAFLPKFW